MSDLLCLLSLGVCFAWVLWPNSVKPGAAAGEEGRFVDREADDEPSRAGLRATAHHEAAHFVALWHLSPGHLGDCLTIVRTQNFLGRMLHTLPRPRDDASAADVEPLIAFATMSLAGRWGEILSGVAQLHTFPGARPDRAQARRAAERLLELGWRPRSFTTVERGGPPLDQLMGNLEARAMIVVGVHWGAIEAVAEALLDKGTLDREEALEAVRRGQLVPKDEQHARMVAGHRRSREADDALEVAANRSAPDRGTPDATS